MEELQGEVKDLTMTELCRHENDPTNCKQCGTAPKYDPIKEACIRFELARITKELNARKAKQEARP